MCGIAGSIHIKNFDPKKIRESLRHRGPDATGIYQDKDLTLVHTRLAIQDLSERAAQPMHYNDYCIIFNGEIYNHKELRAELTEFVFRTTSDTETLLYLYIKFGPACLNKTDGMFALAIYNKKDKKLFLARDRAGKKPLYYFYDNRRFLFASELNAISDQIPLRLNHDKINAFLRLGFFYREATPFLNVFELPAGHYASLDLVSMEFKITPWWNIASYYNSPKNTSFAESMDQLDGYIHTAVQRRLESSDLEVGTFLSSGIDSGLVSAIAAGHRPGLKAFTVSFAGQYDESPMAKLIADKYQLEQIRIDIDFTSLIDDLENIILNYGEPFFDSSAIPSYYVSQEAKKYMTVILNGDGGDELFGGYRRYVPFSKIDFFKKNLFKPLTSAIQHLLPHPKQKMSVYNYLFRLLSLSGKSDALSIYLSATSDIFEDYEQQFYDPLAGLDGFNLDLQRISQSTLSGLNKMMLMDFNAILSGDLLVKMDIATMAHSLEGRSPFLSREILEFAPTLPDRFKINKTQTKFILRELAKKYLPQEVINLPKRGFEIPLKNWIGGQFKPIINDYLGHPKFADQFVKPDFIKNILEHKVQVHPEKRAKMLWSLFVLEVWYKKHINHG